MDYLHKLINKKLDEERNNFFSNIDTNSDITATNLKPDLNSDLNIEQFKNIKPGIIECLVTELVDEKTAQILDDKYLCMNHKTYQVLQNVLSTNKNIDNILSIKNIPVFVKKNNGYEIKGGLIK